MLNCAEWACAYLGIFEKGEYTFKKFIMQLNLIESGRDGAKKNILSSKPEQI